MKNYKTPKGVMWILIYTIILAILPLAQLWATTYIEVLLVYAPIIILVIYILEKALDNIYKEDNGN